MTTAAHWHALAQATTLPFGHFIDGAYSAEGEDTVAIHDPARGTLLQDAINGGKAMADVAVDAAQKAFQTSSWAGCHPRERGAVLLKLAELIEAQAERFAILESLCTGKPMGDTVGAEIPEAVNSLRYFGELPDKLRGETTASNADTLHYLLRQPLGVVAAIVPWNFPLNMAVWKVAPALAAGNSVVLKPAEQTPWTALLLAELFVEAGGPPGVFNVVTGRGDQAGKALAMSPKVAKIGFTGSTRVGQLIHSYVGQSSLKTVALECGGKSPQIVMNDVADMDAALDAAIFGAFGNAGQVCNAGSRLILHEAIHDHFVEQLVERTRASQIMGDPFEDTTTLGPLINRAAHNRILGMIDAGVKDGAELVLGGKPGSDSAGNFIEPTIFARADSSMSIAQQEIFGPVLTILRAKDATEAVQLANDTSYGLAAAIWSGSLDTVHRMAAQIQAGVIWVNCFDAGDMTQPFGGWKQSGTGRDKGVDALMSYTQAKSVWMALGDL